MPQVAFMIPRATDREVDTAFRAMAARWGFNDGNAQLGLGAITECGLRGEPPALWAEVVAKDLFLAQVVTTSFGTLSVMFQRGGRSAPKSPFMDEIILDWDNGAPDAATRVEIQSSLQQSLVATDPRRAFPGLTPEQSQLEAIHNEILSRLERAAAHSLEQVEDYRRTADERFDRKVGELEKAFTDRKAGLEEDIAGQQAKLAQAEKDLAARIAQVDAADNTHARRQIRDRMLEEAKQRVATFGVTENTEKKRGPVRNALLALILVCAGALAFVGMEIAAREFPISQPAVGKATANGTVSSASAPGETKPQSTVSIGAVTIDSGPQYALWLRLTFATLAAAAAIIYYARWENAWAQRHADTEFQLQQFNLDVNRANWVIETCLEWKKETDNAAIPAELLASLTRNLFQDPRVHQEQVMHPADELASAILGSAAHLKLKTDGAEIDIAQPGKKLPSKTISRPAGAVT